VSWSLAHLDKIVGIWYNGVDTPKHQEDEMMEDKIRLSVMLDRHLHREAKVKAALTGKPMAEVMREALQRWVNEDTPPEGERPSKKP
jgi:hypothetical protein